MMNYVQLTILVFAYATFFSMRSVGALSSREAGFPQFTLDYDPSNVALSNDHQDAYCSQKFFERWRIVTNLNGDGTDDLILSEDSASFGNGVVSWHEIRDWNKPSRTDELFDLMVKLDEATRRIESKESELQMLNERLAMYERNVCIVSGVTLGEKWNGGERIRVCEEEFSGFTNMVVFVDASGFVDRICLTRPGESYAGPSSIRGGFFPNEEEMKVIHQIENKFQIRLNHISGDGLYDWGNASSAMRLTMHFSDNVDEDSYINFQYFRSDAAGTTEVKLTT